MRLVAFVHLALRASVPLLNIYVLIFILLKRNQALFGLFIIVSMNDIKNNGVSLFFCLGMVLGA